MGMTMGNYKKFYDKEQMSSNVDALMNDLTETSVDRRKRDEDILSYIRDRQMHGAVEDTQSEGIFKQLKKTLFTRKRTVKTNAYNSERLEMQRAAMAYGMFDAADATEVIDEENQTNIIGEDDATEVIEEYETVATIQYNGKCFAIYNNSDITIGSKAQVNDIVLESRRVSRRHATILCRERKLYISDAGSTNGTYINGSHEALKKGEYVAVNIGDNIILADTQITIC